MEAEVARLAPFGQGNPLPRFATYAVVVVGDRRMGNDGAHRKLQIRPATSEAPVHELVWFGGGDAELPAGGALDFVYTLGVNEYRGERKLQLMYVAHRPAQPQSEIVATEMRRPLQVIDLRQVADPRTQLPTEATWYAEGVRLESVSPDVAYAPRFAVPGGSGRPLVVWSTPPSGELLHWLASSSDTLYLCARITADDAPATVARQVASMAKYALAHDAIVDVGRMAARLGQTEAVVRTALLLLAARGILHIEEWLDGDRARIAAGTTPDRDSKGADELWQEFDALLTEVRAYRRFVLRARVEELGLLQ
jgi:single-stranded-DNA-specific exonuclease